MTLKERHPAGDEESPQVVALHSTPGGMCPDTCRRTIVSCAQSPVLYAAVMWWDGREASGLKNWHDELQKHQNQLGWEGHNGEL